MLCYVELLLCTALLFEEAILGKCEAQIYQQSDNVYTRAV